MKDKKYTIALKLDLMIFKICFTTKMRWWM